MPAPSTESQHPEAWPASPYRHLIESADQSANKLVLKDDITGKKTNYFHFFYLKASLSWID